MVQILTNHWALQCAYVCLFFSYITPGLLALRIWLLGAALSFLVWASAYIAPHSIGLDTIIFNSVFIIFNSYHIGRLLYLRRPIKFTDPNHEIIYGELFKPLGVSRLDFRTLIDQSTKKVLEQDERYLSIGDATRSLTLLLNGRVNVSIPTSAGEVTLHSVRPFQFIESPEWFALIRQKSRLIKEKNTQDHRSNLFDLPKLEAGQALSKTADPLSPRSPRTPKGLSSKSVDMEMEDLEEETNHTTMRVNVTASMVSTVFIWPVATLIDILQRNPQIAGAMGNIVASDVALKLFKTTGTKFIERQLKSRLKETPLPKSEANTVSHFSPMDASRPDSLATFGTNEGHPFSVSEN